MWAIACVLLAGLLPHLGHAGLLPLGAERTYDVLGFHKDSAHRGFFAVNSAAPKTRLETAFAAPVSGQIYAQLLYVKSSVIATTEDNHVVAYCAETGRKLWDTLLAPPVPRRLLPCGNIQPNLGITGTGVINSALDKLFVGAMTLRSNTTPEHQVFALDTLTGKVLPGWPVDVAPRLAAVGLTFNALYQNQRGALAYLDGKVYVPYGGHAGDCGDYRGWVVGIDATFPALPLMAFQTAAKKGGIWTPGGVTTDGIDLFVATGNTEGAATWGGGDAVLRLKRGPKFTNATRDFGTVPNWKVYDARDIDLSATEPVPIDLPKSTPSKLVFAVGKDTTGYLFNRADLGGFGGWVYRRNITSATAIAVPVVYTTSLATYIALKGPPLNCPASTVVPAGKQPDLFALRLIPGSPPSFTTAWCAYQGGTGSPIATLGASGAKKWVVWSLGAEVTNALSAFDGDTGALLYTYTGPSAGTIARFHTPIAVAGAVFYGVNGSIVKFNITGRQI